MRHYKNYKRVIATQEKSAGNESVGDMWIETKSFAKETPIHEIIEWAKNANGKLIITIDDASALEDSF
ncbi:hypothetical protein KAR91_25680 [Candidatus Pacearchaeota archaeon]|nr:hypothetical protein [Candidatus Pacearchaeota archaeon]